MFRRQRAALERAGRLHLGLFLVAIVFVVYLGCGEDQPTESRDNVQPVVEIVEPVPPEGNPLDVSDSTKIVATASDESGVLFVEFFRRADTDSTAIVIRRVDTPDSSTNGVNYYSTNWRTGAIPNGSIVQVFARAVDEFENVGQSKDILVRILNTEELGPPNACFLPIPAAGDIETDISFNANCTTDDIADVEDLLVRWDFDGDGVWEIDTTAGRTPLDVVVFRFDVPGTYSVKMEAFNRYFEGGRIASALVEITNVGGTPRPQSEVVFIPGGQYTIGFDDTTYSDADERLVHTVTVSPYFIEKYEVTNRLYRTYLNKAVDSSAVVFYPPEVVLDTLGHRIINFAQSHVLFDVETDSFIVRPGFGEHPVTGVNWYGAVSYALFYGLRLPTEREWEIAARGDSGLWKYPWGVDIDSTRCNFRDSGDPLDNGTTPVGYYDGSLRDGYQTGSGESPFGAHDMAGNVKEWCRDWYETPYENEPLPNYQGPPSGFWKIIRGGSWQSGTRGIRATSREGTEPETTSPLIGFRTAFTQF
jgi:formylglycine-generating enzyme required for sulfatase activity